MARELTWPDVERAFHEPVYDHPATIELFQSVGTPAIASDKIELAAFRLSELAKGFAFNRWGELQPHSRHEEVEARRLAQACQQVLNIVGSGPDEPAPENIRPFFGNGGLFGVAAARGAPSGREDVTVALKAVYRLRQDAENFAEIASKRSALSPPVVGRAEERAIKILVAGLAHFYFDFLGELPAVTRDIRQQPRGPFVRVLVHVNAALHARQLDHHRSAESLAKIWERLPPEDKLKFPMDKIG